MQPSAGIRPRLWRAVVIASTGLVFGGACAGPRASGPEPQVALDTDWQGEAVGQALSSLACVHETLLDADPYFYDEMQGFNCHLADGTTLIFREYRNADSVSQVLDEWRPVLTAERPATWGRHWFAVGPLDELRSLSGLFPDATGPSIDTPPPAPMTREADELTTCVRLATSAIGAFATDRVSFERDSPHLEALYPGLNRLVAEEVSPSHEINLRTLEGNDVLAYQAALAESGAAVRRFCARQ